MMLSACAGLMTLALPAAGAGLGDLAPAFHLEDLAGGSHRLADMRGEVVILTYWATWCAPCKGELASLDRAYRADRSRGLEVIAITRERGLGAERLRRWTREMTVPVSTADDHGDDGYGAIGGTLPTTYVIDRRGKLVLRRAGVITAAELERIVATLLEEPPPAEARRAP